MLAALAEDRSARRAASGAVLPSCAVAVASDGCVVVPPALPTQRGMWLARLPVRALFDGGVITCSRAVIYHVLLGLSFEAAIGVVPSLDFSLDL